MFAQAMCVVGCAPQCMAGRESSRPSSHSQSQRRRSCKHMPVDGDEWTFIHAYIHTYIYAYIHTYMHAASTWPVFVNLYSIVLVDCNNSFVFPPVLHTIFYIAQR